MKQLRLLFALGLIVAAVAACDDDEEGNGGGDADVTTDGGGDGGSDVADQGNDQADAEPDEGPDVDPDEGPDVSDVPVEDVQDVEDEEIVEVEAPQRDRMGRPGVNTVLIGTDRKDDYNEAEIEDWAAFTAEIRAALVTVDGLDENSTNAIHTGNAATLDLIAGVLTNDRLRIDTEYGFFACGYLGVELDLIGGDDPGTSGCGGRQLADDVIDTTLGALVGPGLSDNVDENDCEFPDTFPFLASANCGTGQVDRMGRPGVNTVFVSTGYKDAYNQQDSVDDWDDFTAMIQEHLVAIDALDGNSTNALHAGNTATIALIAGVLANDRIRIDTEYGFLACGFLGVELDIINGDDPGTLGCGGRQLEDDVIDSVLGALVGPGVSDNVDENDCDFEADWPFLAADDCEL